MPVCESRTILTIGWQMFVYYCQCKIETTDFHSLHQAVITTKKLMNVSSYCFTFIVLFILYVFPNENTYNIRVKTWFGGEIWFLATPIPQSTILTNFLSSIFFSFNNAFWWAKNYNRGPNIYRYCLKHYLGAPWQHLLITSHQME